MKVYHGLSSVKVVNSVATIGIFDGVHLAHQAIIDRLNHTARSVSGESVIVTLWPHPKVVLSGSTDSLKLLSTLEEKITKLEEAGVDNLVILKFDKSFAAISFDSFVKEILFEKLGIKHLVVGFNHQFGRNREGNYNKLLELSGQLGFSLEQLEPVLVNNERVSSSSIRKHITIGQVQHANQMLGYDFFLTGTVTEGNKIGRQIGFPTANIKVTDINKIIPADGVYAVIAEHEGIQYKGMLNIGYRPTVDRKQVTSIIEVHLLNYTGELYGLEVKIFFIDRVREEQKFDSINDLRIQLGKDKESIINVLSLKGKRYL